MGVEPNIKFSTIETIINKYPDLVDKRGIQFLTQHMCASTEKAKRDLNWEPKISLKTGLEENINWMHKEEII